MSAVTIIGVGVAERVFEVHYAQSDGRAGFVRCCHAADFLRSWHGMTNA